MAQSFDVRRLRLTGSAIPIAERIVTNVAVNRPIFSASEIGTLVYQTGGMTPGWQLVWFGWDGKESHQLGEAGRYFTPALSPDGKLGRNPEYCSRAQNQNENGLRISGVGGRALWNGSLPLQSELPNAFRQMEQIIGSRVPRDR